MLGVTRILGSSTRVVPGGEKFVESAVRHNHLDPVVGIGLVVGLTGGAQVHPVAVLHTSHLSQPEAGKVPVVHRNLGLGVFLRVGANEAVALAKNGQPIRRTVSAGFC